MTKLFSLAIFALFMSYLGSAQEFDWAKTMGSTNNYAGGYSVMTDNQGNVITTGFFTGTMDFDPGPGVSTLVEAGMTPSSTDIFIQKMDSSGNFIWVKQLSAPDDFDNRLTIATDPNGEILIAGGFRNTVDFDPGPNVENLTALGQKDIFVLKLDGAGNFLWVKQLGAVLSEQITDVAIGPSGNIYLCGYFNAMVDFDPDPNVTQSVNAYGRDYAFILKFDAAGNYVWVKTIGNYGQTDATRAVAIALDANENVCTTGDFNSACDFDPGPGISIMNHIWAAIFIQKMDKDGNFLWAKMLGGTLWNYAYDITTDLQGNIYTTGSVTETSDFDPGPNILNLTAMGSGDYYVQKLDPLGNLVWANLIGSVNSDNGDHIVVNSHGEVYITGTFSDLADFDAGPDTFMLSGLNLITDNFIQKLDSSSNFLWAKATRFSFLSLFLDKNGDLLSTGGFAGTADFDLGPGSANRSAIGQGDFYVLKMASSPYWDFHGTVFSDLNDNQLQEPDEPGIHGVLVEHRHHDRFVSTDSSGQYHFFSDIRNDTIGLANIKPYWTVSPLFAVADSMQTPHDFAVSIPVNARDVSISALELPPFRPGFETEVVIQVSNEGVVSADSVVVKLEIVAQPTPSLEYVSALPIPLTQTVDQFHWLLDTLHVGQTTEIRIRFRTPAAVAIGTPLKIKTSAVLVDDIFPTNNSSKISTWVVGSYDPNDKQVTPSAVAPLALDTTDLRYVIRFQNTGNYPADFVVIRDTLPVGLDLSTLKILSASHPYTWRLYGPRVLEFRFDNINLPDSTTNAAESNGFVAFAVQAKKGLPPGTSIRNKARIYFDFNAPVLTNIAVMKVANVSAVNELSNQNLIDFSLSPNPVAAFSRLAVDLPEMPVGETKVMVSDALGKIVQHIVVPKGNKRVYLDGLSAGSYFVQVRAGRLMGGKVLIVK
jgi:hypothetical protein